MGETGTRNRQPWLRLGGLVVLALLLTVAVAYRALELSSLHGRLSVPPLYDDVAYFLDAAKWLNAAGSQSAVASILELLHQHAPFSTLVAAIGFRLFPDGYIGPYLVHAAVVFAFLLGIVWLTWKRPFSEVATCLIAAACVPMVWHTVTEARPDLPWGLAIGMAAGAILHRGVLHRGAMSLAAMGAACGLAVSVKPTAFPASIVFLGSVFAIRLFFDCLQSGGLRASARRALAALLWFCLGLIATAALLIGPALIDTFNYILNVFVYQRDLWTTGEGFWVGLQHFSVGAEGKAGLHYWLWVGLALMGLRLLLAATKGRAAIHEAVAVLAAVVIAYAIPSIAEIKTYFFGAIFYGVFIIALAMNFCANQADIESRLRESRLGPAIKRHALAAVRALPLVVAALLFGKSVITGRISLATPLTAQQQEAIRGGTERLWSLLRDVKPDPPGPVSVGFSSPYPVTPTTIQLYAAQAQMNFVVRQEFFHRTVDAIEKALLESNILVISSSIPHGLLAPRVGDELITRMDANKDVCLLESLAFPDVRLRIYRRGPC